MRTRGSAVGSNPVDGTSYTADAAFGGGSEIGTGNFVVYKGTGTSVMVTGLTTDSLYYYRAYEFNDTVDEAYNTDTAADNPNSESTGPVAPVATARHECHRDRIYCQLERGHPRRRLPVWTWPWTAGSQHL